MAHVAVNLQQSRNNISSIELTQH